MLETIFEHMLRLPSRSLQLAGIASFAVLGTYCLIKKRATVDSHSQHHRAPGECNQSSDHAGHGIRVVDASASIQLGFLRRSTLLDMMEYQDLTPYSQSVWYPGRAALRVRLDLPRRRAAPPHRRLHHVAPLGPHDTRPPASLASRSPLPL